MWKEGAAVGGFSEGCAAGGFEVGENLTVTQVSGETVMKERTKNRWLMAFYDTVLYIVCWIAVFGLHPLRVQWGTNGNLIPYMLAGCVLFFAARLVLKCYKMILRYGAISVFAREICADILSGVALLGMNFLAERFFHIWDISSMLLLSFLGVYILVSLAIRMVYCYLYRFAEKKGVLSKIVRYLLERLAFVDFRSKVPGATLRLVLTSEKTTPTAINELQRVVDQFAIRGDVTSITQINKGYINRTYRVETLSDAGHVHKYTLQRINTNVFPDVDALMDNFKLTTDVLHGRLRLAGYRKKGSVQMLRTTKDGRSFLRDDSGCWRMLTYFDDVYSLDIPDHPETFYHAGVAFGSFLKGMKDVSVEEVKIVIPNFHNTQSRYLDLEKSIAKDPKGRVASVQQEIEFVRARKDRYGMISDALESGRIPTRICHNDCNLNNILFDNETHLPVAIIDLDTVMPSSPLYDYGDSMRIGTNTAKDDEKDLSKVSCDLKLYEQYARGYLEACGDILTKEELELLPYAALIITSEDGIRFLMDHIDGDTYYTIYYPGQNLDRSRTQLKLVEDMERKLPEIKKILRNIYKDLGLQAQIQ